MGKLTTDLISLIQPFVNDGIQKGADEVEVFAQKEAKNTVNIEANTLKSADISKLQGVGIRVLIKNSLGFASVSSLDPAKIETTLQDAISIAKSTPADEHNQLPSPKKLVKVKGVYDEAIEKLSIEQALQHGSHLLDSVSKIDQRISTYIGGFVTRISEKAIATSNDIQASEKKTICYYYLAGMAIDASDIGVFDIDGDVIVKVDDIDTEKMAQRFATKVLRNLGAEKTDSFEGPAILSPYAVEVLFQTLIHSSYASTIQAGQSFLQNRVGDQLASPNLTIEDNGILPNSYASSMFDREGNPHRPIKILDSGKYTGILHNTFTARKDKIESTGHAIGTFRETPTIGPTNLKIHKGSQSLEQLIAEINHGILIQRIDVFPDPISGDFSATLKGAKLIKNGELTTTLKEITTTGNLYEHLNHITGIENTLHPEFSENTYITNLTQHWLVPHIRIENLKFTA